MPLGLAKRSSRQTPFFPIRQAFSVLNRRYNLNPTGGSRLRALSPKVLPWFAELRLLGVRPPKRGAPAAFGSTSSCSKMRLADRVRGAREAISAVRKIFMVFPKSVQHILAGIRSGMTSARSAPSCRKVPGAQPCPADTPRSGGSAGLDCPSFVFYSTEGRSELVRQNTEVTRPELTMRSLRHSKVVKSL